MKPLIAAAIAALAFGPALAEDNRASPLAESHIWNELRTDLVGEIDIADAAGRFEVQAPYRANDAATVPVTIRQTDPGLTIRRATVVIDDNPAPLAASFTFGPAMAPLDLEIRVRVNQYSNIRVIADTDQGHLMTGRYVKASGGCSAPATRNPEEALAGMGEMRLKHFSQAPTMSTARREAQIMIRHPNYSGLQRDQLTQLFILAHFIDRLELWQGDEMLFTMEGGISISENPVFRFSYTDNGAPSLRVIARDTEGNVFEHDLPKAGQS
ncbi:quinoprotein dehydrogenase-associated SoxYZ-like carrier [Rhodovulum tesquicola]|uniref:quinoprotein dehydrogenase-associated SoxYZ-like carrier n=1 Tax=Rhodovulum tesquicola TaxID=540254 RepID=UPI0020971B12|nr:quinoprotein dehydrogenase-associated SoxYZ-like carrier [Rhodovulum tesquicola]MCO8143944.1 quinoprotein dehydrogenase-associated SoxYZ-like carrier [Rhodovulum tesquicola]